MEALEMKKHYTYADYISWDDDERYEIINGVVYNMGAPTERHQWISANLHYQLMSYLRGKTCRAYAAPFDVRLAADKADDIVVQPDLLVICDMEKLADGKACIGAPDMVVEILSNSTKRKDRCIKHSVYRKAGVREFWVIEPEDKTVEVYLLIEDRYVSNVYLENDTISITVLDNCKINLADIFS